MVYAGCSERDPRRGSGPECHSEGMDCATHGRRPPGPAGKMELLHAHPVERPAELKGKAVFTEDEAAAYEKRAVQSANVDGNRETTATARG